MSAPTQTTTDDRPVIPPPETGRGGGARRFLGGRLRQVGIFIALIAIVILFQVLTDGRCSPPATSPASSARTPTC